MNKINFCDNWVITNIPRRHSSDKIESISVNLPYDITIHTKRNSASKGASHTGYWDGGEYRYTKKFFIASNDKDKLMFLEFEGIYANAMVYINGSFAANCPNGYTNYYVQLNDFIKFDAENEVAVFVKTGCMPNSRWYTGTGIYRPVYLYKFDKLHIPLDGIQFTTESVTNNNAIVSVSTKVRNDSFTTRSFTLVTTIFDEAGNNVGCISAKTSILTNRELTVRQRFYIENAKLWDEFSPNLYRVITAVYEDEVQRDSQEIVTGIRTLSLDPKNGLRVNGRNVKLRGACIHHTSGFIGANTFECEEERKVSLLKEAGFNAIRIAHQPSSKALLKACDKLGMYLMEESFDQWNLCKTNYDYALRFAENWERDVEAFVCKDFNHPCVIMYSIGNEINDITSLQGSTLTHSIAEKIRSIDPTRYITNAINGMLCITADPKWIKELGIDDSKDINEIMDSLHSPSMICRPGYTNSFSDSVFALDIIGYNYMSARYDIDCVENATQIYVGTETFPKDIGYNWDRVRKYDNLIGDFTWTGMEYLGEAGIARHEYDIDTTTFTAFYGTFPQYYSGSGDITLVGDRLPISYYREIVFGLRKDPYIAVWSPEVYGKKHTTSIWGWSDTVHYWRWPGYEGDPVTVEVYSNAEEVELFINGVSTGRSKVENYKCVFDTEYQPGEIVAVSYSAGAETGRQTLTTAGNDLHMSVSLDRDHLSAGAQDIAHLLISLHDENDRPRIDEDRKVSISVEGAGELIGMGSSDPLFSGDSFLMDQPTYHGKLLAYLRSSLLPGKMRISITVENIGTRELSITVD